MSIEKGTFTRRDALKGAVALAAASILDNDSMPEKIQSKKEQLTPVEKRFGERLELGGVPTPTIDIRPDNPTSAVPMLVAPGFGASIHTNAPMLEMLASEGRRVLSLDHPLEGDRVRDVEEDILKRVADYPRTELRKASNLLEMMDKKGIEKVDCFAFSEGALNTLLAAYMYPERFNSIILTAPAGLIGQDTLFNIRTFWDSSVQGGLTQRFRSQAETDNTTGKPSVDSFVSSFPDIEAQEKAIRAHMDVAWKEDEKRGQAYPLRSVEDLWALSHMQIDDMVAFVRAAGVKVAILTGADDQIYPSEVIAKRLPKDSVDGFMTTVGAHGPNYSARVVNYLFDLLGKKREREEREKSQA
ncbi:alpha/beta hydrolase [Candidatus Kaiserbacteria bacterium]|nr:alpha/beta hydrolase [Candidatus Kaiserbacteria bacterium]